MCADHPVQAPDLLPAQEDVGRRLHQPLAGYHPLPVMCITALAHEPFEYRFLRLLQLQEQRVIVVAAEHQQDVAAGADAAHPTTLRAACTYWNSSSGWPWRR